MKYQVLFNATDRVTSLMTATVEADSVREAESKFHAGDYYNDYFNRRETIDFGQISDWIDDDYEGDITAICEEKGVTKEDLQKEIYDTIVNDNIIGFKYDW